METTPIIDYKPHYGAHKPVLLNASSTVQNSQLKVINLSYTVQERLGEWYHGACFRPKIEKKVLKNIDMSLKSGEVTAIIGSSGSGKTSLLDAISCRQSGKLTGDIFFKNYRVSKELMMSCASYVIQADRLLPHLTVRETLRYTAYICLPANTSAAAIEKKVESVMLEMGLIKVADSLVGGAILRGLSGGEKRRVSIAIQLLKNPEILILDEPTTGLDSFTARYLVKILRDLARSGKIVLMTIHQPRSDIFRYFDQVAILCQGELTYFGRADEIVAHFTRLNFPCPVYANPLDNYIDVCSIDRRTQTQEIDSTLRVQDLVQAYRDSPQHDAMVASMTDSHKSPHYIHFTSKTITRGSFRTVYTLLHRLNTNLIRDKVNLTMRILGAIFNVMLVIMVLGKIDNDQVGVQNRGGLFFQSILATQSGGFLMTILLFPSMRDVFYRECRDGFYGSTTFIIAHSVHTFPFHVLATVLASLLSYWVCGLYSDFGIFCQFVIVHLIICLTTEITSVAALGVVFNFQVVNTFMSMVIFMNLLISTGIMRATKDLPSAIKWLSYLTPIKYGFEIIMANEYTNINLTCTANLPCSYPTSDSYLDDIYPDAVDNHDENYGWMMLTYLATNILAFVIFKLKKLPNLN